MRKHVASEACISESSSDDSTKSIISPCTFWEKTFPSKEERYEHENTLHNYNRKGFFGLRNGKALKKQRMEVIRSKLNKEHYSSDDDFSNECDNCQITFDQSDDLRKYRCKKRKQNSSSEESDKIIKDLTKSIQKLNDKIEQ